MFVILKYKLKEKAGVRRKKCPIHRQIETPWYTEIWDNTDLENALKEAGAEVNEENITRMRESCRHIFDDKSERNEQLIDIASTLFKECFHSEDNSEGRCDFCFETDTCWRRKK